MYKRGMPNFRVIEQVPVGALAQASLPGYTLVIVALQPCLRAVLQPDINGIRSVLTVLNAKNDEVRPRLDVIAPLMLV